MIKSLPLWYQHQYSMELWTESFGSERLNLIKWWSVAQMQNKLEAVLFRAQVSTRFGIVIMGLRCLLLSKVAIECVKEWHLFLDLVGMRMQI